MLYEEQMNEITGLLNWLEVQDAERPAHSALPEFGPSIPVMVDGSPLGRVVKDSLGWRYEPPAGEGPAAGAWFVAGLAVSTLVAVLGWFVSVVA